MKNKKLFYFSLTMFFTITMLFFISSIAFAAPTPRLVIKLSEAFDSIQGWLFMLATPAAAVALGVGLFMKKFSFGDEERMRSAKKVIRGSLVSYGLVLAIDLILQAIKLLIG